MSIWGEGTGKQNAMALANARFTIASLPFRHPSR